MSNPTTARNAPPGTATRILDLAEQLVQMHGFNGFSYADLAEELDIRKASVHHHFARPMVPAMSKVIGSGSRSRLRVGGGHGSQEPLRRLGDLGDGLVEGGLVGGRRLAVAAHLPDELEGCGGDLVIARRRGAGAEGLDASAHARRIRARRRCRAT